MNNVYVNVKVSPGPQSLYQDDDDDYGLNALFSLDRVLKCSDDDMNELVLIGPSAEVDAIEPSEELPTVSIEPTVVCNNYYHLAFVQL